MSTGQSGQQAERQDRKPRGPGRSLVLGCAIAVVAVGGVGALLVVGFFLVTVASAVSGAGYVKEARRGVQVREATLAGTPGRPKVALIPIRGILMRDSGPMVSGNPVRTLEAMLERAADDRKVRAVILAIDSPGGGVTTSDVMHRAIKEFRKKGKPAIALLGDLAASGGYYVSCAAEHIMAHPTSTTGSIGVMMPLYDASDLMEKIGVTDRSVKSGRFKALGSPFQERTPEQWQKEREILGRLIERMHSRFVEVVTEGRGLKEQKVRELADGRIFSSRAALEAGLIDSIGYQDDAVQEVKEMAGLQQVHLVEYGRAPSLTEVLFASFSDREIEVQVAEGLPELAVYRPLYLWQPPAGPPR